MASDALREILSGAVPLYPDDRPRLVEWAEDVQAADGKLLPGAGFGMDTTGVTIDVQEYVGDHADVEPGSFDEGWIATPGQGNGDCPTCDGNQPVIALSHKENDIILIDCINCQTRYSTDALGGDPRAE